MDSKSIKVALWEMKNSTEPFLIQFVKVDGSITRKRCLYQGAGNVSDHDTPIRAGLPGKFTLEGRLPLYDVDAGHLVTPFIAHIVGITRYYIKH